VAYASFGIVRPWKREEPYCEAVRGEIGVFEARLPAKISDICRRQRKAGLIFPVRLGTLRAALHEILVRRFQ
jgi:hypothetical protein